MRRALLATACLSVLFTLLCITSLHFYPNLTFGKSWYKSKPFNASVPQYLTEQINHRDETIAKLLLQIDDLRAINQKQAGELKVEKGPESSSHSLHLSSSSSNGGGGGADSNSALSLFGLHGVRVMPFCNESDGSFLPPLVSYIQAPPSLLHLYSDSRFLLRLALTRRCRRAKTILRAMLSRCFRLHTR